MPVAAVDTGYRPAQTPRAAFFEQPAGPHTDTAGQLIDEKSANDFQNELDEGVVHSRGIMALAAEKEKTGKASLRPVRTAVQLFPSSRAGSDTRRAGCRQVWLRPVLSFS